MLKILGRLTSANVQKVMWLCDEVCLSFNRSDIGGPFGGNDKPEYLELNPNGRVPTVIDDGFVIWESNACVHYLASKHASGSWYPADLQQRGRAVQWMEWVTSSLANAHMPVFQGLIRTSANMRNPQIIAKGRDAWSSLMAMLDEHLKYNHYIVGDTITMGDISPAVFTYRWFNLDIPREDYPHLLRWYESIAERPAFKRNVIDTGLS